MRTFSGPSGVVRRLDSVSQPKSVRGTRPIRSPVVSCGLPWPPVDDGKDDIYSSEGSHTTLAYKF